ncbi:ACO13 thioesterase, partial [Rhodinocichla rosea]|nr:ACO13 thioesterase [Rhodinocichla rosea]
RRGEAPPAGVAVPGRGRAGGGQRGGSMGLTVETLKEAMKYMVQSKGFDRVLGKVRALGGQGSGSAAPPGQLVCMAFVPSRNNRLDRDQPAGAARRRAWRGCGHGRSPPVYTSAAKIGEEILITAQILKQGKTLAFATVDLTDKATGKLIAQGRHTKFLGN